jgi:transposase-like protein
MQKKRCKVYYPIEKSDILKKVLFEGVSVPEVCKLYHINPRTVNKWKRQFINDMPSVFVIGDLEKNIALLKAEIARMRRGFEAKISRLASENVILKDNLKSKDHDESEDIDWDELIGLPNQEGIDGKM